MKTNDYHQGLPPIKVIGVGGGGCNAVSRMASQQVPGVELIAVNTDGQALLHTQADVQVRIGDKLTRGRGAGGDPAQGLKAAEESRDELLECVRDAEMVFVTSGMGGGTGTGASPVVAELACQAGSLTIGVVTRPFGFEGTQRGRRAEEGIRALQEKVDTLIIIPNDRLLTICDPKASIDEAFRTADEVLLQGIQGISEVITLPGIINLDFSDVRRIMGAAGPALLSIGRGRGDNRALDAARSAISSPLLDVSIRGARGVLFNIVGSRDLSLQEVNQVAEAIKEVVHEDADIAFGAALDEGLGDDLKVTIIATGFQHEHGAGNRIEVEEHQPEAELPFAPVTAASAARMAAPQDPSWSRNSGFDAAPAPDADPPADLPDSGPLREFPGLDLPDVPREMPAFLRRDREPR